MQKRHCPSTSIAEDPVPKEPDVSDARGENTVAPNEGSKTHRGIEDVLTSEPADEPRMSVKNWFHRYPLVRPTLCITCGLIIRLADWRP